ncbi:MULTISPECIES: cell wall-binding protein [unclassified Gemella]|uniref:cell wall-binding protein n=1 Tax=unclassified Gemella TaxID=2624949 RepID=UPI001C0406C0|nr:MULTISPECIES: cell wall-binding protein [unclassified Gemella]MBU0278708.1 cell wall-binding protein [Gemella sp. zg-1178]QWQ39259.1 cell wall-binding protein [Gemella sp. zg-570]
MKKSKILLTALLSSVVIVGGCSNNTEKKSTTKESSTSNSKSSSTNSTNKKEVKDKIYGLNEYWVVDGQWKLKIDSVTTTTERNQFYKDEPAQVVVITYTYENLGYKGEFQDLFFTPYQVVDGGKKVSKIYPIINLNYVKPTPEGAIMEGAQKAFGLSTESKTIKVMFDKYDSNKKRQKATFEVPVE